MELDRTASAPYATGERAAARGDLRAALWPFLASRAIADVLILTLRPARTTSLGGFASWDGRWYRHIAAAGYPGLIGNHHQSGWAFAPLLPLVMAMGRPLGVGVALTGVVVNHVAFFVALVGLHRSLRRRASPTATTLALWALALFPATFVFSMVYPSALFLASSVWAFVFVDEHRDVAAGVCAAGAMLARPNGFWLVVGIVVAVGPNPRRLVRTCAPAIGAFAGWVLYNLARTGDPVKFYVAKRAWHEVTLFGLFERSNKTAYFHLLLAILAVVVVAVEFRRLPRSWLVFTAGYVLPSLFTGIVGMGRYANECFPPFAAAGNVVARQSPAVRVAAFATLVAGQIAFACWVLRAHHVP